MINAPFRMRDVVRLYGDDDWFNEGQVCDIDLRAGTVDVDFSDWIQRYPISALRPSWTDDGTYESILVPFEPGIVVEKFALCA